MISLLPKVVIIKLIFKEVVTSRYFKDDNGPFYYSLTTSYLHQFHSYFVHSKHSFQFPCLFKIPRE